MNPNVEIERIVLPSIIAAIFAPVPDEMIKILESLHQRQERLGAEFDRALLHNVEDMYEP